MSEHGIHVSITGFSEQALLLIPFSRHTNSSTFIREVNNIDHGVFNKDTRTTRGLEVTLTEMFNESNGMRPEVPKTFIFMTDGECNTGIPGEPCPDSEFEHYRDLFKKRDIKMIGIGVGEVDLRQLKILLGDKGKYFQTLDFTQLTQTSFIRELSVCDGMLNKYFNTL